MAGAVFRGYRPSAPLAGAVELIWMVQGLPAEPADRVLPNGVVELILNLGDPQRVVHGPGRFTRFHRAWIAGLQRGPLDIATERGSQLVGIRFRPGGAAPLLGLPLAELTDRVVEVEGRLAADTAELRERLAQARDDGERLPLVEAALSPGWPAAAGVDPRVARAIRGPGGGGEALSVARAGGGAGRLAQAPHRSVPPPGGGGAQDARRASCACSACWPPWRAAAPVRLTDLAYSCGYADQAHLSASSAR